MGAILLFIIGLVCLLATLGFILKYLLGFGFDDDFISNFVKKSLSIIGKIFILIIAICFVWIVISMIQSLFI